MLLSIDETFNTMDSNENNTKKKIVRSAAYPAIDLKEAVDFANKISEHFTDAQSVSRADIAAVLDKSEGTITRPVAALVHYSLVQKTGEGYQLSTLYKDIRNPINDKDLKTSLIKAFNSPKLFLELIEKFNGHVIPEELRTHLVRFHSISEKVADDAAENFLASGRYAGVINDKNILNLSNNNKSHDEESINDSKVNNVSDEYIEDDKDQLHLRLPAHEETPDEQIETVPIRLKGGKHAYLKYPADITKKDLKIIRRQLDVLEAYVEDDEE